jgi:hypothetical protein
VSTDVQDLSKAERHTVAEQAKAEGMEQAQDHADPRVQAGIDLAIEKAIDSGRRFSANTIRDQTAQSGQGLVGARFNSYVNRRVDGHPLMVHVGWTTSDLPSTHNHQIKVWLGYDAHQALQRARVGASA